MRAAILGAVLLAVTASSGIALAQETQSESATAEPACSATTPCLMVYRVSVCPACINGCRELQGGGSPDQCKNTDWRCEAIAAH
jgi:hypothetical protein